MDGGTGGTVTAVSSNGEYAFTKPNRDSITLLAGLGVEGDAHAGVTVKHRSRMAQDPTRPNLRQVHLIHQELFAEVAEAGFTAAGDGSCLCVLSSVGAGIGQVAYETTLLVKRVGEHLAVAARQPDRRASAADL